MDLTTFELDPTQHRRWNRIVRDIRNMVHQHAPDASTECIELALEGNRLVVVCTDTPESVDIEFVEHVSTRETLAEDLGLDPEDLEPAKEADTEASNEGDSGGLGVTGDSDAAGSA